MSQTTTSTATFRAAAVRVPTEEMLLAEVQRMCGDLELLPSSARLATLARGSLRTSAHHAMERLDERFLALQGDRGSAEAVKLATPLELTQASRSLVASRAALAGGDSPASEAFAERGERALTRAMATTGRRLAAEERHLLTSAVAEAFGDMGLRTAIHEGESSTGVKGECEHEVVLIRISDGGVIETDVAGLEGGACRPLLDELGQRLAARGVVLETSDVVTHGDARGGTLFQEAAAAASDGRLEVGVVIRRERGVVGSRRSGRSASRIRPQRQAGGMS